MLPGVGDETGNMFSIFGSKTPHLSLHRRRQAINAALLARHETLLQTLSQDHGGSGM